MSAPPPHDETAGDLSDQLLRLTRRLNHAHRHNFAPVGVTPAQARLLRTLTQDAEPPRMADLAERLGVVPRQVTTLVDGLEEHGLVRRAPDATNRRVTRILLTDGGHRALKGLREARKAAAEEILAPLSGEQRDVLSELLTLLDTGCPGPSGTAADG